MQNLSSSIGLDGECRCTSIFRSLQRCSFGIKSGHWLGHSKTKWSQSHSFVILAVLRVVILLEGPEVQSTLEQVIIKDVSAYWCNSPTLTHLPVPTVDKHPYSMMLPPLCFTVGWYWPGDAWHLGQRIQSLFHQTRELCFHTAEVPLSTGQCWSSMRVTITVLVTSFTKALLL